MLPGWLITCVKTQDIKMWLPLRENSAVLEIRRKGFTLCLDLEWFLDNTYEKFM